MVAHASFTISAPVYPETNPAESLHRASRLMGTETLFHGCAWARPGDDFICLTGAFLPRAGRPAIEAIQLPRAGEMVYQGLPMARFIIAGGRSVSVPAPVTGAVLSVNSSLLNRPSAAWDAPFDEGWIARVMPTRFEDERANCAVREAFIVTREWREISEAARALESLGCHVTNASRPADFTDYARTHRGFIVVLDAESFEDEALDMAVALKSVMPEARLVVRNRENDPGEDAFRALNLFYYGVSPMDSDEWREVIASAFHEKKPFPARRPHGDPGGQTLNKIDVVNRDAEKSTLMASGELLKRNEGVGRALLETMLAHYLPIQTAYGARNHTPADWLREASRCQRLLVVDAEFSGRIPGQIRCEPIGAGDPWFAGCGQAWRVLIQPEEGGRPFEPDAAAALAAHLYRLMMEGVSTTERV
ncbi:MAG: hypothetical protein GC154_01720 [bacterium]|nr:hypothetical protein [bacterium]